MKLKTLKDLDKVGPRDMHVRVRDLKAEAIRWVKECRKGWKLGYNKARVLMDFLNITEEDLK